MNDQDKIIYDCHSTPNEYIINMINNILENKSINREELVNCIKKVYGFMREEEIIKECKDILILDLTKIDGFKNNIKYIIATNESYISKIGIIDNMMIYQKDNKILTKLLEDNMNKIKIIKIFINMQITIIKYNNELYYISDTGLINDLKLINIINNLFEEQTGKKIENIIEKNKQYIFTVRSDKIKKYIENKNRFLINDKYSDNIYIQEILDNHGKIISENIEKIKRNKIEEVKNMDELYLKLSRMNEKIKRKKKVISYGYRIIYSNNDTREIYEVYTDIYNKLMNDIPYISNINEVYLVLYYFNILDDVLPYLTNYVNEIKVRIKKSLTTIAKDILNIYHATRKCKNPELYNSIPDSYKNILVDLHKLYIDDKKIEIINKNNYKEKISIQTIDVYRYLKTINITLFKQLYYDRNKLMENNISNKFINTHCIYTLTQVKLMCL